MNISRVIDQMIKTRGWEKVALVDLPDVETIKELLAYTRAHLTVQAGLAPDPRARDYEARLAIRSRKLEQLMQGSYAPRLAIVQSAIEAAPGQDAIVLLTGEWQRLFDQGTQWLTRLRAGGWIIGNGAYDSGVRSTLDSIAPGWRRWDGDLWEVQPPPRPPAPVPLPPISPAPERGFSLPKRKPGRPRRKA